MRVIFFESWEYRLFVCDFWEDGDETSESGLVRRLIKKCLNENIVNNLAWLWSGHFVDSVNFIEVVVILLERILKPVDAVEKEGEMFWRVDRLLDEVVQSMRQKLGRFFCHQNKLIDFLGRRTKQLQFTWTHHQLHKIIIILRKSFRCQFRLLLNFW